MGKKTNNIFKNFFNDVHDSITNTQVTVPSESNIAQSIDLLKGLESCQAMIMASHSIRGGKIIVIGNGGSSSIASHMVIDLWKNCDIEAMAFIDSSALTALANDYGVDQMFARPIEMFSKPGDVVIAISSSGNSPNIINGVKEAIFKECSVITMSGFGSDNQLRKLGNINFYVPYMDYGVVETAHATLCHSIINAIIFNREKPNA